MSKQIHVCPICFRSNYDHTGLEVVACKSQMKKKSRTLDRAHFSEEVKALAKKLQKGLCRRCKQYWTHAEFHHTNDRCGNSLDNCAVLCRDCHFEITFLDRDR